MNPKPPTSAPPKSAREYMRDKFRRLNLLDGMKSETRGGTVTPTLGPTPTMTESSCMKENTGMDAAQRPYNMTKPISKEYFDRMNSNKPQNFNTGQTGQVDGFIACIWGCGAQIKRGVQFTSNHNRYKNMYQLAHKPACPKIGGLNNYYLNYDSHWDGKDRETPTPAIRESYNGTNKTKVGFEYGKGAFVLQERKVRKHPENKYKRKTDEEQKKKQ